MILIKMSTAGNGIRLVIQVQTLSEHNKEEHNVNHIKTRLDWKKTHHHIRAFVPACLIVALTLGTFSSTALLSAEQTSADPVAAAMHFPRHFETRLRKPLQVSWLFAVKQKLGMSLRTVAKAGETTLSEGLHLRTFFEMACQKGLDREVAHHHDQESVLE